MDVAERCASSQTLFLRSSGPGGRGGGGAEKETEKKKKTERRKSLFNSRESSPARSLRKPRDAVGTLSQRPD